jgi:hypothetical protein
MIYVYSMCFTDIEEGPEVECYNSANGCAWMGDVAAVDDHTFECGYHKITCPNKCMAPTGEPVSVMRKDAHTHLSVCEVEHKRVYEETIRERKTVNIHSVRLIHLGIPRSGKTTFWHRMLKLIVRMEDSTEPSTGVADEQRPVLIKGVKLDSRMVTPDKWHSLDEGDYAKMLLE